MGRKIILSCIKPHAFAFLICPILIFAEAMSELMLPNIMASIVNDGIANQNLEVVISSGIKMLGFALLSLTCGMTSIFVSTRAAVGFGASIRLLTYKKIQSFSFANIENFHTASLITRLTNDTSALQQMVQAMLRVMIRAPLMLIGSIFMALQISGSLISVLVLLIPVLFAIIAVIFKRAFPLFLQTQKRLDRLNTVVQENLAGVRVVKAFAAERHEEERFGTANGDLYDIALYSNKIVTLLMPSMMLALNFGVIAVIWLGGIKVQAGDMAVGDIMAYTNYLANILQAVMMMSFALMSFSRAHASFTRILEVLDSRSAIVSPEYPCAAAKEPIKNAIEFRNVCFSYSELTTGEKNIDDEEGSSAWVLNDINFSVERGKTLGIIGSTGSGKSTLVSLIPRLYDAGRGCVSVEGCDVKLMELENLRKKIGFVMQDSILFSGTVAENIRWGKPDATDDEVEAAAKLACADEFIRLLPDKYETIIGQRGVDLSGGQKQRLCMARVFIQAPEIIILDDATSALDFRTESAVRRNIASDFPASTKLIVAQRVGSIIGADEIIVLEHGEIVERGTHDELFAKGGVYRAICDSQPGTVRNGEAA